jgi:hypothetical protein
MIVRAIGRATVMAHFAGLQAAWREGLTYVRSHVRFDAWKGKLCISCPKGR